MCDPADVVEAAAGVDEGFDAIDVGLEAGATAQQDLLVG